MEYDVLKIKNQLCFPLYVVSKEIIRKYSKILGELDLTYTQYITMLAMWEVRKINVKTLGEMLYLDSGTLTPVLKKLEQKKYIKREKLKSDERNLIISITQEGLDLREKAKTVPKNIGKCINLDIEDSKKLYEILYKILDNINE